MEHLTIGKLARQSGVGVETLRYYERRGLIKPQHRTASGYRIYNAEAAHRLQFVRRAQALGFSLDEIAELLHLNARPNTSAADVKQLARDKIIDIESRISDLQRMREALLELECLCPGDSGTIDECPILAALSESTDNQVEQA